MVADASTVSPSASRKIGEALKAKGIDFLDAPCTGSTPGATGGTLTFMVGGDQAIFEKTKPFLEPMGKKLYYCGGPGMGLQAKLTQKPDSFQYFDGFQRGHGAGYEGRGRPETHARYPGQQRR
ncbi:MAG: NAD(P)-binding domain-containing protein [Ignavibacteriota bacterium]